MKSPSRTLQNAVLLYSIGFIVTAIFFIVHFSSRDHIHSTYHLVTQDYVYSSRCSSPYPLSFTNRLYKPLKEYNKVQLIFYRKMKMSLAVEVCQNNGWILSKTIRSRQELQSQLDNQNVFSIVFTSSKELSNERMNSLLNQTNVLVSAIPNAYLFTGAKREQYITFQRYLNRHKCSINELKFMPVSFLMDNVKECEGFYKYMRLNRDSAVWVLKKSQGYGGDGVTVMSNRTAIKLVFDTCPSRQQYIMQEYLQDMLLLNGRKFDIRALFLIANTKPYMLFYHDGYLRVVMSQFYETGGREVHLTNTHVQSMQPNFSPNDHFWSFKKLQSHLDVHYPDNEQYVQSYLIPYIKKVGIFIVKAGKGLMNGGTLNGFQLLGLDFMITNDWHIWFIEANNYPLWPKGGWITKFTTTMGEDLFDLAISIRQRPKKFLKMSVKDRHKSWQLIWREKPQNCPDHYNPCNSLQQSN